MNEHLFFSGVLFLTILIPVVSTKRASVAQVFIDFNSDDYTGIHNKFYLFMFGLLMSQYTLSGYDASAYMVREKNIIPECEN